MWRPQVAALRDRFTVLPNLEMPEAFNRVVREFLEEVAYPRASIGT